MDHERYVASSNSSLVYFANLAANARAPEPESSTLLGRQRGQSNRDPPDGSFLKRQQFSYGQGMPPMAPIQEESCDQLHGFLSH